MPIWISLKIIPLITNSMFGGGITQITGVIEADRNTAQVSDVLHRILHQICAPITPGRHVRIPLNNIGNDYFVGDIHGERELLERALDEVGFRLGQDRLISVGDLISRGPDSFGVVDMFGRLPGFYFAPGNHELMLLAATSGQDEEFSASWRYRYGGWFTDLDPEQQDFVVRTLKSAPVALEVERSETDPIGVIHADWPPGKAFYTKGLSLQRAIDLATTEPWGYEDPIESIGVWSRMRCSDMRRIASDPQARMAAGRMDVQAVLQAAEPIAGISELVVGHNPQPTRQPAAIGNVLILDSAVASATGALTLYAPDKGQCYVRPLVETGRAPQWIDRPRSPDLSGWQAKAAAPE